MPLDRYRPLGPSPDRQSPRLPSVGGPRPPSPFGPRPDGDPRPPGPDLDGVPQAAPPLLNPNVPGSTITPFGPRHGDLRGGMVTPGPSPRTTAAAGRTDAAADRAAGFSLPTAVGSYADNFAGRLRQSPVGFQGVDPNVTQDRVQTDVSRRMVDPRVQFQSVNTDLSIGERIRPEDSQDLLRFRGQRAVAADAVSRGNDRSSIARDRLSAFDARAEPRIRDQLRSVGQRAAALGRIGMGETSVEALRPYTDYLSQRAALEKDLAADTAAGEIEDRRAALDAARALVGEEEAFGAGRRSELRGERSFETAVGESNINRRIGERDTSLGVQERNIARDLGLSAEEAALMERNLARRGSERDSATALTERNRARAVGERDTAMGLTERNHGREFDANRAALEMAAGLGGVEQAGNLARVNTFGGLEDDLFGREADQREELRTERDYQSLVERQALEDAIRQQQMEWGREGDLWNRDFAEDTLAAGLNPAGVYMGGAGLYGQAGAGAYGGAADLLGQWLARERGTRRSNP